jgi:hypothetical protein
MFGCGISRMTRPAGEAYLSVLPDMGTSFLKHKMVFTTHKDEQCQNGSIDIFVLMVYAGMCRQLVLQLLYPRHGSNLLLRFCIDVP